MLGIGSVVKIIASEQELKQQGLTLKGVLKVYPRRIAVVKSIYNGSLLNNYISYNLHRGFSLKVSALEDTGIKEEDLK